MTSKQMKIFLGVILSTSLFEACRPRLRAGDADLAQAVGTANMNEFQVAPQKISGISFPRNGLSLYRGMNHQQFDTSQALKALLGGPDANLDTYLTSEIKFRLKGQTVSFARDKNALYFDDPDLRLSEKIKAYSKLAKDDETIDLAVKTIAGQTYRDLSTRPDSYYIKHYINYESKDYIDWPTSLVFTSIYSAISALFGDRVVVVEERTPRSLDLNYWNFVVNDRWLQHGYAFDYLPLWTDRGEFVAWGYIPSDDIVGYQIRDFTPNIPNKIRFLTYSYTHVPIPYAFYRYEFEGKKYALAATGAMIQSGKITDCIHRTRDQYLVHCKLDHIDSASPMPALPEDTTEAVRILGVFTVCDGEPGQKCQIPAGLVKQLPMRGGAALPEEYVKTGEALKIYGKTVRYFPF